MLHAGTARRDGRPVVTSGGRVLAVTAVGDSVAHARDRAYAGVDAIEFPAPTDRSAFAAKLPAAAIAARSRCRGYRR